MLIAAFWLRYSSKPPKMFLRFSMLETYWISLKSKVSFIIPASKAAKEIEFKVYSLINKVKSALTPSLGKGKSLLKGGLLLGFWLFQAKRLLATIIWLLVNWIAELKVASMLTGRLPKGTSVGVVARIALILFCISGIISLILC